MKHQFLLFLTFLLHFFSHSQINTDGNPLFDFYTDEDYGNAGQIWSMTQDKRGVMYFGCNYGLKTYDGKHWKSYMLPYSTIVRSLATHDNGMVFYGAEGDFGAIISNEKGELTFLSFPLNKLKNTMDEIGTVWKTIISDNKLLFQTFEKVYYCDLPVKIDQNDSLHNEIKIIESENSFFHVSFSVHDTYYIREWDKGLYVLKDNKLELIPGGEQFASSRVYIMHPFDETRILIGTRYSGFYIFDPKKKKDAIQPFALSDQEFLNSSDIYLATALSDGSLAISSFNNGVIIINKSGEIIHILDKESGFPDNRIWSVYNNSENKENILWFCSDKGIVKAHINNPFTKWDETMGISQIALSAKRYNGVLYMGTKDGLYYLEESSVRPKFKLIKMLNECWDLFIFNVPGSEEQKLLLSCPQGIFEISDFKLKLLYEILGAYKFYQSEHHPETLYIGSERGLYMTNYENNTWGELKKIESEDLNFQIRGITEYDNDLALGIGGKGVYLLEDFNCDKIIKIDSSKGFPLLGQDFEFEKIARKTVILSGMGLHALNDTFDVENFNYFGELYSEHGKGVYQFIEDENVFWLATYETEEDANFQLIRFFGEEKFKVDSIFSRLLPAKAISLLYADSNRVWICNEKGLYEFNKKIKKEYSTSFHTLITTVKTVSDSLLFAGNEATFKNGYYQYSFEQNSEKITVLNYGNNGLIFKWAAPFFENEKETEFSYRLIGETEIWSKWEKINELRFTNLREGDYTFEVKARNIYNTISSTASYKFKILPPWYRNNWAYIGYFIIFVLLVFLLVKLNTRRLQKDKERLEDIVEERTAEIVKQKEEISVQRDNLDELNKILAVQKEQISKQRDEIKKELKETILKSEMLKKESFQFQLKSIANQMNPHFMFNTLNAVKHFIVNNEIEESDRYLGKFARLMRLTLQNSLEDSVPIKDEIEALSLYLDLEKLRSKDKFVYSVKIDGDLDTKYHHIPSMLIQPFIENALLHGIYNKEGNGEIKLELIKKENVIQCIIEDNGIGMRKAKEIAEKKRTGHVSVGTSLIDQRLKLISELYDNEFGFEYSEIKDKHNNNKGTKVKLNIPIVNN